MSHTPISQSFSFKFINASQSVVLKRLRFTTPHRNPSPTPERGDLRHLPAHPLWLFSLVDRKALQLHVIVERFHWFKESQLHSGVHAPFTGCLGGSSNTLLDESLVPGSLFQGLFSGITDIKSSAQMTSGSNCSWHAFCHPRQHRSHPV